MKPENYEHLKKGNRLTEHPNQHLKAMGSGHLETHKVTNDVEQCPYEELDEHDQHEPLFVPQHLFSHVALGCPLGCPFRTTHQGYDILKVPLVLGYLVEVLLGRISSTI